MAATVSARSRLIGAVFGLQAGVAVFNLEFGMAAGLNGEAVSPEATISAYA
jgi:hypothetical protein